MTKFLLILVLLTSIDEIKSETGIYLPIKCTRHNKSYRVLLTSKEICLAGAPIISFEEFEKISPLTELNNQIYFDLTFSHKAYDIFKKLNESFPYTDLAMVVEDEVFMVFSATDRKLNQTFRFQSDLNGVQDFRRIHGKLLTIMK